MMLIAESFATSLLPRATTATRFNRRFPQRQIDTTVVAPATTTTIEDSFTINSKFSRNSNRKYVYKLS